eukprot:CAMPEP_0197180454 /NCGR_PEP_ID=MMETSP1423-20130617/5063_1 /TAXON_ID=476441 /ORGANISM="Pseudo-nitzschia heimii, Strain UNC1101" /LENGTH=1691 /DNA_ID=CAMNT_0042630537 /DNA_START=526 /DNA_END=5601 /DNA_ORIENTATION=+
MKRPPSSIPSHITTQQPQIGGNSSPTGLVLKTVSSSMSQEEIQAEERLKRAENKIGSMLEDLEELKFFQEIEMETPGPNTPRTPKRISRPTTKPNGVPTTIRSSSPARGMRLPPPLSHNKNKKAGGLETYKPMSPRSIARLDRNSLELECQTIVRKLQILEQELFSHQATIEMYEITLQEHDNDKTKINRLEGELQKVSTELRKQLYNIQKGKESLVKDYEEKLQNNMQKLHRTQEKADLYQADLQTFKSTAQKLDGELEKYRSMAAKEKAKVDGMLSNEETLQLQLTEARNLNTTLVKKVEKKRLEVSELKEDLSKSAKLMEESNRDLEHAHESQVTLLEQQLDSAKERYSRVEQECTARNAVIAEKDDELKEGHMRQSDYEKQINEMSKEVEFLRKQVDIKFEEGKKAVKLQEVRNAQKLVAERANASREYEQRIKAMQEQLRHQTDRHHKEIEETNIRNKKNLESMKDDLREELRVRDGDKVSRLESEILSLRRNHKDEKLSFATRLQDAQQKARNAAEEFQRQDQMRQQELDHLHGRLNSYFNDFTEKDNQILRLRERLEENEKIRMDLETIQTEQSEEIAKHIDLIEAERTKFVETEAKLDHEIATMKETFTKRETNLTDQIQNLSAQIDVGQEKLSDANDLLKETDGVKQKFDVVQIELDRTKQELLLERARIEGVETDLRLKIAKLEGQLQASDSALQDKKTKIETLEKELDVSMIISSKEGEEKQNEINSLKKELKEMTNRLETSTSVSEAHEIQIREMYYESGKLKQSLSDMSKIEDDLQDMKRMLSLAENEKKMKEEELFDIKSSYEFTQSKILEVEKRYSTSKEEFNKRLQAKKDLIERCEKTIKDLEFTLERERGDNNDLKASFRDLQVDKRRKESDLATLRKDYEELTGLLEENLHNSAKNDEVDLLLKKKEIELRETVEIYNRQFSDLENKMMEQTTSEEELKSKNSNLQTSLDKMKAEKLKIFNDLKNAQKVRDALSSELEEMKEEQQNTLRGISADIGKKDSHLREAVQRYTRTIANLEKNLEEETQSKAELEDRLLSARSELEDKQKKTQEMVQRHTKTTVLLESKLAKASTETEELKTELDVTKKDLMKKEVELTEALEKIEDEFDSIATVKKEHSDFRDASQSTRDELQQKEEQIIKMRLDIDELRKKHESESTDYKDLKIAFDRNEVELKQRKEQINKLVSKYTDRIAELESKVEDNTAAITNSDDMVETVQAQSERKDKKIRELMQLVAETEAKLDATNRSKESVKVKSESLSKELDEKESRLRTLEVDKIELETKLHTHARSKDEARAKMSELSKRLERKEREVREVSDRYKIYVMELESKLDQDTDTKHNLQLQIDKLRNNLDSASEVSSEAMELRQKVNSLEMTVVSSNETTASLKRKLEEALKSRKTVDSALQIANAEKAEVIAALEGVINEVQNREDEIESLSDLLQRRDEELEHAKIIATKALASAKDIQKRYKEKSVGRHSDLMGRMNDVSNSVDRLTTKNEALQRKISSLERDLRDKNLECKRLKDQLKQLDAKQMRENIKDDISAISTQSTDFTSFSNQAQSDEGVEDDHRQLHFDQPISIDSGSFSPTNRTRNTNADFGNTNDERFSSHVEFPSIDEQYSKDSLENSLNDGTKWQDFDNDSKSGFDSVSSEQQSTKSRRSVERDALRKYVRQRYSKRGEK